MSDKADNGGERISAVPEGPGQGLLTPFEGAMPPAPEWFEKALLHKPEEGRVEVDGTQVAYRSWGDPSRPGVLLTHGNGAHGQWWDFIAPFLAKDYHVVANSLSGMGDSGWRDAYSLKHFAHEQLAVAEHAGFFDRDRKPVFVGHSLGGFVTACAGAIAGDRLLGIVLADSPIVRLESSGDRTPREIKPTRIYPSLKEALTRFRLAPPQDCDNLFILDHIARHSLRQVEGGWTWKFDPHIWQRLDYGKGPDYLEAVSCRIGILYGGQSAIFTPEMAALMSQLVKDTVPMVEIPEAQHHVLLDQPLAFVTAVRAFLEEFIHSAPRPGAPGGQRLL